MTEMEQIQYENPKLNTNDEPVKTNLLSKDEMQLIENLIALLQKQIIDDRIVGNSDEHIYQFWKYFSQRLFGCAEKYNKSFAEIERQKTDVEHFSMSEVAGSDEYAEYLSNIGELIKKRRDLKDIWTYMKIAGENIGRIANFICNMKNRQYTPRSMKYGGSGQSDTKTSIKVTEMPEINGKPIYK